MCLQIRSYYIKSLVGGRKQSKEAVQGKGRSMSKDVGWSDIIKKWNKLSEYNNQETSRWIELLYKSWSWDPLSKRRSWK